MCKSQHRFRLLPPPPSFCPVASFCDWAPSEGGRGSCPTSYCSKDEESCSSRSAVSTAINLAAPYWCYRHTSLLTSRAIFQTGNFELITGLADHWLSAQWRLRSTGLPLSSPFSLSTECSESTFTLWPPNSITKSLPTPYNAPHSIQCLLCQAANSAVWPVYVQELACRLRSSALLSETSITAVWPTQPRIQWVPGSKRPWSNSTLRTVPNWSHSPHTSCGTQRQCAVPSQHLPKIWRMNGRAGVLILFVRRYE
jgi:hypothetical protein